METPEAQTPETPNSPDPQKEAEAASDPMLVMAQALKTMADSQVKATERQAALEERLNALETAPAPAPAEEAKPQPKQGSPGNPPRSETYDARQFMGNEGQRIQSVRDRYEAIKREPDKGTRIKRLEAHIRDLGVTGNFRA